MPFSDYLAGKILNHTLRGDTGSTAYTQPSTVYVSIHSASPTSAGLLSTEISGGSYERQLVAFGAPSSGVSANTAKITFSLLPSVSGGITHFAVWDADTAGNMLWFGDITPQVINSGDSVIFAIGGLTVKLYETDVV